MRDEAGIVGVLWAAKIDKAGVGDDPHVSGHQAVDIVGSDDAAVLDPKARHLVLGGELRLGRLDGGERLFQLFDLSDVKRAIETALERATDWTREAGGIVLKAGHELRACQTDARGAGQQRASIGGVEMLAADHHADALAYRVGLHQLGELLDFDGAVAGGGVGECGDPAAAISRLMIRARDSDSAAVTSGR